MITIKTKQPPAVLPLTSFRLFCELGIRLRDKPFSLDLRPYLQAVYASTAARIVLRCSRQVEKSTLLCNRIIFDAIRFPGRQILYVCPRQEQALGFSKTRLRPAVQNSPPVRRILWPYRREMPAREITFKNGSRVFIRAAFNTADAVRGISADELLIDEYQDMAADSLAVLGETLSHSEHPATIIAGTPKWIENQLETAFHRSTAHEWQVACPKCQHLTLLNEKTLGPNSLISPCCSEPLDPQLGVWVPRHPLSTWADGFHINHPMTSWNSISKILERQQSYDRVQFLNEVLGLPSSLGDYVITREEMEARCEDRPFIQTLADIEPSHRGMVVMGVDWGGGANSGTVAVIGHAYGNNHFRVLRMDRWLPHADPNQVKTEVASLCVRFGIRWIAADDNGQGSVYNRILYNDLRQQGHTLRSFFGILYTADTAQPTPHGALQQWQIGRTPTIGGLFSRVKMELISFPRVSQSGPFFDDFVCVMAEFDDKMRMTRYTKPDDRQDDALHATNYAEMLGLKVWAGQGRHR